MYRNVYIPIVAALLLSGCDNTNTGQLQDSEVSEGSTEPSTELPVWPREAARLGAVALSDLVVEAIASDRMGWDHLQSPNILWVTDGINYGEQTTNRIGYARVIAGDSTTKLLRQSWEELAWTVELSTEGNAKWGPTLVELRPGIDSPEFEGKYICFGEGFEGCSFGIAALNGPRISFEESCTIGAGANKSVVMRATTNDGRRGTVVYRSSGGSGGISNSVEITTSSAADYCQSNMDRGY